MLMANGFLSCTLLFNLDSMYDEQLANRVREALIDEENVTEKSMFQGLCFMVNDKMCVGVRDRELMCRMTPEKAEEELDKGNCREMIHNGKAIKGYIFVDEEGYKNAKDFKRFVNLCLDFNKIAKKRKTKRNG